jgi:hypothetical protein
MKIVTKAVSDIQLAIDWARLSYGSEGDEGGEKDQKLAKTLAECKAGSGHDSMLKGIVVHAEFTATHDFILQLYRYHFRDTVSSESKMHSITKGSIGDNCSKWVHQRTIGLVDTLIATYNEQRYEKDVYYSVDGSTPYLITKEELFECIIHNTPLGYELTFGEVTNYLQIKTMVAQRASHKMSGWSETFIEWARTLPQAEHLIFGEKLWKKLTLK